MSMKFHNFHIFDPQKLFSMIENGKIYIERELSSNPWPHWRKNPFIGSLHLAFEEDENMGKT